MVKKLRCGPTSLFKRGRTTNYFIVSFSLFVCDSYIIASQSLNFKFKIYNLKFSSMGIDATALRVRSAVLPSRYS